MPIEGTENLSNTSDATAQNTATNTQTDTQTAAGTEAAATQTASTNEAPKTFTQADIDRIVSNRLASGIKAGVKAELKKLTGDETGGVTLEGLQTELATMRTENQTLQARNTVRDYIGDAANQLNVPPANVAAIEELVHSRLTYEDGKPSNLKDAVATVKSLAPALFANQPSNIDAGAGRTAQTGPVDMNKFIRKAAGHAA